MSDPVRAAVVGVGFGRAVLMPAIERREDIELVAVCAARKERADAAGAEYGVPGTDDVRSLVDDGGLDLLLISSPPRTHAELATYALERGVNVYSTKPLALELADARSVAELARDRNAVTAMDFDMRFFPVHRFVRRLVGEGYLGELRVVVATMMWPLGTLPTSRLAYWGWTSQRAEGGVARTTMGPHVIDLIRFMFGEIESASGMSTTLIREKPILAEGQEEWGELGPDTPTVGKGPCDAEDTIALFGRFAGGGIVSFVGSSAMYYGSGIRFEAYGSNGTLVLDAAGRLHGGTARDGALSELAVPAELGDESLARDPVGRYDLLLGEVAATIRGEAGETSFATFADGLRHRELAAVLLGGGDIVSVEARLQVLEDHHEIERLLFRYSVGIRDGDPEAVASCFSDDGRLELGIGRTVEGRDAIRAHAAESVSGRVFAEPPLRLDPRIVSTPVVGNVEVEVQGDSASSTCVGIAVHGGIRDGREVVLLRGSVYADDLIRTPHGWRIRGRKQTTLWQVDLPAAQPLNPR